MLIVFLIIVLIGLIVWAGIHKWDRDGDCILGAIGITGLVIVGILSCVTYFNTLATNAKLEAFYLANQTNYAYAIQETGEVLSVSKELVEQSLIPVEGSIEKWEVGKSVAQRIAEYRDGVNLYNEELNRIRFLDRNIHIGIIYPTPPENLKLIIID